MVDPFKQIFVECQQVDAKQQAKDDIDKAADAAIEELKRKKDKELEKKKGDINAVRDNAKKGIDNYGDTERKRDIIKQWASDRFTAIVDGSAYVPADWIVDITEALDKKKDPNIIVERTVRVSRIEIPIAVQAPENTTLSMEPVEVEASKETGKIPTFEDTNKAPNAITGKVEFTVINAAESDLVYIKIKIKAEVKEKKGKKTTLYYIHTFMFHFTELVDP